MTKIVWIIQAPINIYNNMALSLKRLYPEIEIVFVMSNKFQKKTKKYSKEGKLKVRTLPESFNFFKIFTIPYYFIRYIRRSERVGKPDFIYLEGLRELLAYEDPDTVISNLFIQPYTWQAAKFCKINSIPFILTNQTMIFSGNPLSRFIENFVLRLHRKLFSQSKYILCWSEGALEFAYSNFDIMDPSKIRRLYAGVNLKNFHELKSHPSEKDHNFLKILLVGRFVRYKNHQTLFKALNLLKENQYVDFKLNLLGSGPYKKEIIQDIDKLNLREKVFFLEKRPHHKMKNLYSEHDILVLPSYKEPIGMVVPEAMACGTPVIVSEGCGASSYVESGLNGFIFRSFDYKDLAIKILLLKDKRLREKFSKNAINTIKEKYDLKEVVKNLYNLIK